MGLVTSTLKIQVICALTFVMATGCAPDKKKSSARLAKVETQTAEAKEKAEADKAAAEKANIDKAAAEKEKSDAAQKTATPAANANAEEAVTTGKKDESAAAAAVKETTAAETTSSTTSAAPALQVSLGEQAVDEKSLAEATEQYEAEQKKYAAEDLKSRSFRVLRSDMIEVTDQAFTAAYGANGIVKGEIMSLEMGEALVNNGKAQEFCLIEVTGKVLTDVAYKVDYIKREGISQDGKTGVVARNFKADEKNSILLRCMVNVKAPVAVIFETFAGILEFGTATVASDAK